MDSTPNLQLPYLIAAQAQKHVTHNEALRSLDAIVQLLVLDKDLAAPPGSPSNGDRYIVAASPTGAWTGQAGKVAAWQDAAWVFYTPREGWLAWVADEDKVYAYTGSAWAEFTAAGTGVPLWGINATADTTNRLAVKSTASLFDNVGNGHQQKINKAAAGDTASTLYQTGYSGRAEYGLTGDDNFHVKVSPNGSVWSEAMVVDRNNGNIGFGTTPTLPIDIAKSAPFDFLAGFRNTHATGVSGFKFYDEAGNYVGHAGHFNSVPELAFVFVSGRKLRFAGQGDHAWFDMNGGNVGIDTGSPSNKFSVEGIAAPQTDNAYTLGTSGKRWSEVYAATGTINTSDGRGKTDIADSPLGLDFVLALRPRAFKWLAGATVVEWDEESYEAQEPVLEARTVSAVAVEVVEGVAVQRRVERTEQVPVVDEAGAPVTVDQPLLDDDGEAVVVDGVPQMRAVQRMHAVPRTRTVTKTRRVKREVARAGARTHYGLVAQEVKAALEAAGAGDFAGWVLADRNDPDSLQGLRMDQFLAPLIRSVQELAARNAALEARVAALEA